MSQGINTKGLKKVEILAQLDGIPVTYFKNNTDKPIVIDMDALQDLEGSGLTVEFKGVKETHPIFDEVKEYLPYLLFMQVLTMQKLPEDTLLDRLCYVRHKK